MSPETQLGFSNLMWQESKKSLSNYQIDLHRLFAFNFYYMIWLLNSRRCESFLVWVVIVQYYQQYPIFAYIRLRNQFRFLTFTGWLRRGGGGGGVGHFTNTVFSLRGGAWFELFSRVTSFFFFCSNHASRITPLQPCFQCSSCLHKVSIVWLSSPKIYIIIQDYIVILFFDPSRDSSWCKLKYYFDRLVCQDRVILGQ